MNLRNVVLIALILAVFCYRYVASDQKHLDQKTYIVHMDKSVMPSPFSNHIQWYETTMRSVSKSSNMLYTYNKVMHGFSARLTVDEANLLKQQHGILAVHEEPIYQLHTTRTPEFLGLERLDVKLLESNYGSDVIVGVVDSGIWPASKSLDDTGFGPIPSKWNGKCETGKGFEESSCNRKLIGARYFLESYEASHKFNETLESRSPVDDNGHGTHCATTAVGSAVGDTSLFGYAKGTARGMAPHARLAVYKVCWLKDCTSSDVLAAFESAIDDGVDILSVSLGPRGRVTEYAKDLIAIGAFKAATHGIFVSFSAGNSGPSPFTVSNVAPWVVTVGASSLDRDFPAYITLGNGKSFSGVSLYTSTEEPLTGSMVPLVFAGSISNITFSNLCYPGTLPPGSVTGKIVMCEMGVFSDVQKGMVVKAAGGAGMILANTVYRLKELEVDLHVLPTVVVNKIAHDEINKYIDSNRNSTAKATFLGTKLGVQPSPIVAGFSSRGPNPLTPYLLKPDVIAPGVNILAGWTGKVSPTNLAFDPRRVEFNIISGTSMACPHVSGLAVLLKIAHPDWSPAAMQSALMTTAYNTYKNGEELLDVASGKATTPFDVGAGHVDIVSALDPGLVYNASTEDYLAFLCALYSSAASIKLYSDQSFECVEGKYRVEDLNYPSFGVPFSAASAQTVVKYTRTLTNVGTPTTYKVLVSSKTDSVQIIVEPEELTFVKKNEMKIYTVTFIAGSMPPETTSYARLAWSGGKYVVNSPIAFSWN